MKQWITTLFAGGLLVVLALFGVTGAVLLSASYAIAGGCSREFREHAPAYDLDT
jgi:hypothetical protein